MMENKGAPTMTAKTPPAANTPAPAPKLRLKWERWNPGSPYLYKNGARASVAIEVIVARAKSNGFWAFAVQGVASKAERPTKLAAQLAAEAAARELAETKLREAEELWPGITKEKQDGE
jgi:hypothetical protein